MADMAASVLARLKNKAKESGRSYQLCLPRPRQPSGFFRANIRPNPPPFDPENNPSAADLLAFK